MEISKRSEIADDFIRLVGFLVVEIDEGELVADVSRISAVGKLGEIFLTGSERLLIVVRKEIRHRYIIEAVLHHRAVGEILEKLGKDGDGFLKISRLELRNTLEKRVAIETLRLWKLHDEIPVEAAHLSPVAALDQHFARECCHLLGIFRVRKLGQILIAKHFYLRHVLELGDDPDLRVRRFFRIRCGTILVTNRP